MEFFIDGHFHPLDRRNSLVMQNVRVLCYPLDDAHRAPVVERQISAVYDPNLLLDVLTKHRSATPYRLIEKFFFEHLKKSPGSPLLDIGSRQAVIDYVTREKIRISAQLLVNLLDDGGFYRFDLSSLCENNEFTIDEMGAILRAMLNCCTVFKSLTIGGNFWIYESALVNGPLKSLLNGPNKLLKLETLRLQQLPVEIDLICVFKTCPSLICFEISQPSLTGRQLKCIAQRMTESELDVCSSLRSLHLPSSVNETGLLAILPLFRNLSCLHCTPFEQLLDCLDDNDNTNCDDLNNQNIVSITGIFRHLQSLSIMHPLSNDACERLVKLCPKLRHLRVEVQQGMNLTQLVENLPKLRKLELTNSSSMPLDYTEHVQPALDRCGLRLESLSLEVFNHINVTALATACPNLKHLSAQWFNTLTLPFLRYYRQFTHKDKFAFRHLERLRLRPLPHQSLSETLILFFLNNSHNLRHIELYSCSELTDTSLESVGVNNPLSHLQSFIIRHGHNVTNDALFRLLSRSSVAGSLVFHDCGLGPPEKAKIEAY